MGEARMISVELTKSLPRKHARLSFHGSGNVTKHNRGGGQVPKQQLDDLQAVRTIADTLEPFSPEERERIIRWAGEKVGMSTSQGVGPTATAVASHQPIVPRDEQPRITRDVKTFVQEKAPQSDQQLAATVAYFYAFESPAAERKESIGSDDLIDACRKAGIRRPRNAGQTLRNSAHAGYVDKAADPGHYRLNAVGENLVAMVLPDGTREKPSKKRLRKAPPVKQRAKPKPKR